MRVSFKQSQDVSIVSSAGQGIPSLLTPIAIEFQSPEK